MNKEQWITILLDGSAEWEEIVALLAMSYELTASKTKKRKMRMTSYHDET